MNTEILPGDAQEQQPELLPPDTAMPVAWEQVEPGRFMPRRIRGSYRGGKLG